MTDSPGTRKYVPHHSARLPEDLRTYAREMRAHMTDAEALLWKLLRNRRIANAKFRRQHLLGRYILDFYCDEKKLVDCNSGFGRKRRPSGVQGKAHSAAIPGYREHVQRRHARRSGDRHFPIHCYSSPGIELDGNQHMNAADYDQKRDDWLRTQGIRILRFWNNQVLSETGAVLESIYMELMEVAPAGSLIPDPSPACGRREHGKA